MRFTDHYTRRGKIPRKIFCGFFCGRGYREWGGEGAGPKNMNTFEKDRALGATLAAWRMEPPADPGFRGAVWAGIEAARRAPSWPGYVRTHLTLATGLMAVALVAGGWIGREQARVQAEADRAVMAENYVRALDARTMRMP